MDTSRYNSHTEQNSLSSSIESNKLSTQKQKNRVRDDGGASTLEQLKSNFISGRSSGLDRSIDQLDTPRHKPNRIAHYVPSNIYVNTCNSSRKSVQCAGVSYTLGRPSQTLGMLSYPISLARYGQLTSSMGLGIWFPSTYTSYSLSGYTFYVYRGQDYC